MGAHVGRYRAPDGLWIRVHQMLPARTGRYGLGGCVCHCVRLVCEIGLHYGTVFDVTGGIRWQ